VSKCAVTAGLAALALSLGSLPALASAPGQGYVGAALGRGHLGVDCGGTNRCDNTHTGGKLFGGYRAANGWAGELIVVEWGRARATAAIAEVGIVEGLIKARGYGAAVAYHAPVSSDWLGVLRVGALSNRAQGTGVLGRASQPVSERHANLYFGLGIGYRLMQNLSVYAAVDASRIKLMGDTANTALWSLGLSAAF
jgi:hypothetical protein